MSNQTMPSTLSTPVFFILQEDIHEVKGFPKVAISYRS
jgi:hypothetical protein